MVRQKTFRDRDFISTPEGFFFCAIGNIHPQDRIIAYIKYVPNEKGKWGKKKRFKRILRSYTTPSVKETFQILEKQNPEYLFHSKFLSIRMSAVPMKLIKRHYKPEEKLLELFSHTKKGQLDSLEEKVVEFMRILSDESDVNTSFFGVTGSILLEIHNPVFSDLDIIVYGRENMLRVREAMKRLYSEGVVDRFEGSYLENWATRKAEQFPITSPEAKEIYNRTWSRGFFKETLFSIHPVKLEAEVKEKFGDSRFIPKELITIHATITGIEDSFFLPATYQIGQVTYEDGRSAEYISKITSYDGFYCGIFEKGEAIVARGKLEEVVDSNGKTIGHRLLVGSFEAQGEDYIKVLNIKSQHK